MALMMGAFHDAPVDAGASETKARAATEEAAGTTEKFASVRRDIHAIGLNVHAVRSELGGIKAELKKDIQELPGKFDTMRWMVGFYLALTVAILFMLVRVIPH